MDDYVIRKLYIINSMTYFYKIRQLAFCFAGEAVEMAKILLGLWHKEFLTFFI